MTAKLLTEFENRLRANIPLVSHMGLQRIDFDGQCLVFAASLAPNVNDKGTAFGGSVSALAVLSGWALTTLALAQQGIEQSVVVKANSIDYLAPIDRDFDVVCRPQAEDGIDKLLEQVRRKGRGRLDVVVEIHNGDRLAVRSSGTYVAI